MGIDFLEELVCKYNKNLKKEDLHRLYKLSYKYNIFNRIEEIFKFDFETILNYIILDELPYSIASKLVNNGKLLYNFVSFHERLYLSTSCENEMILEYVSEINNLLNDET